jgi:hypothetical protein
MLLSRRHRVGLSSLLPFCFEILPTVKMARRASKGLRRAAERATAVRSLLLTVRTAIHVEVSQALPVAILAPWPESAVSRASSWCRCVPTVHPLVVAGQRLPRLLLFLLLLLLFLLLLLVKQLDALVIDELSGSVT